MSTSGRAMFTRDFVLLLVAVFGALANYAPLLSVVPLWAASGGAGGAAVGATTAVMMGGTVATQLAMRRLLRLLTLRRMVALGSLVMAVATPAYLLSNAITPVLVVSAVRGAGFALVVVGGAALVSELVADSHLSRGTGLFGLAAGLPNVVALPLGVLAAQRLGFLPVFVATTALALLAVPLTLAMSGGTSRASRAARSPSTPPARVHTHPPLGPLTRPAAVFLVTALGLGATTTFLPLAVPREDVASAALFAMSLCMIGGRLGAGSLGDRLRPGRLMLPAVVLAGAGMSGIAVATGARFDGGVVVVVAAGVFGLGFGAVQNDSLVVILRRSGPGGHGTASTVWNVAYDGGTGAGAILLGAVVAGADYSWAFGATALGILAGAPAAWRLGTAGPTGRGSGATVRVADDGADPGGPRSGETAHGS